MESCRTAGLPCAHGDRSHRGPEAGFPRGRLRRQGPADRPQDLPQGDPPHARGAERAKNRLIAQVEAERIPDRAATVAYLLDRWVEVADHELSTRVTNEGYIRRTLKPALGDIQLRKLQHRVDILDRLYTHLRRCAALCDGRLKVDHRSHEEGHDCAKVGAAAMSAGR